MRLRGACIGSIPGTFCGAIPGALCGAGVLPGEFPILFLWAHPDIQPVASPNAFPGEPAVVLDAIGNVIDFVEPAVAVVANFAHQIHHLVTLCDAGQPGSLMHGYTAANLQVNVPSMGLGWWWVLVGVVVAEFLVPVPAEMLLHIDSLQMVVTRRLSSQ